MAAYEIKKDDIIKQLTWVDDPNMANNQIKVLPGAISQHFAKVDYNLRTDSMRYVVGDGYEGIGALSPEEQAKVRASIASLRDSLDDKLKDITRVPSEECIFYNSANGNFVLIGWGHDKMPTREPKVRIVNDRGNGVVALKIRFLVGGQVVGGRQFTLNGNPQTTDAKGEFRLANLKANSGEVTVVDSETGKEFKDSIGTEDCNMDLDVSAYADIRVAVRRDGVGQAGKDVVIAGTGVKTDGRGEVETKYLLNGRSRHIRVEWGSESREVDLVEGENVIAFDTYSAKRGTLRVVVREDGTAVESERVRIRKADGTTEEKTTDGSGAAEWTEEIPQTVDIEVRGEHRSVSIDKEGTTEVAIDFAGKKQSTLRVRVRKNRKPIGGEPVEVESQGIGKIEGRTNNEGVVDFVVGGTDEEVRVGVRRYSREVRLVEDGVVEVVFDLARVDAMPQIAGERDIEIYFYDKAGKAIEEAKVEVKGWELETDEAGRIGIPEKLLQKGEEIEVRVSKGDKKYEPAKVGIEDGIYEYEVRERKEKGSNWLLIALLCLLFIVLLIISVWAGWSIGDSIGDAIM